MNARFRLLEDRLSTLGEGAERVEARVAWAACAAQCGRVLEAREVYDELRRSRSEDLSPRVAVSLIVLDAIVLYYANRSRASFDRIDRARRLAAALSFRDIWLSSCSWMAHFAFNFERNAEMLHALEQCASSFDELDPACSARVSIVMADALQFVGEWSRAGEWYQRARSFARQDHDHSLLSTIEYNRLCIGQARARVEYFMGCPTGPRRNWVLEAESVQSFHEGVVNRSLVHLLALARARSMELVGRFDEAIAALLEVRATSTPEMCGLSSEALDVEVAWCELRSKSRVPAWFNTETLANDCFDDLDSDDRVAVYSMLVQIDGLSGVSSPRDRWREAGRLATVEHSARCEERGAALLRILELVRLPTENKKADRD